jgi:hypothetical protein
VPRASEPQNLPKFQNLPHVPKQLPRKRLPSRSRKRLWQHSKRSRQPHRFLKQKHRPLHIVVSAALRIRIVRAVAVAVAEIPVPLVANRNPVNPGTNLPLDPLPEAPQKRVPRVRRNPWFKRLPQNFLLRLASVAARAIQVSLPASPNSK